MARWAALFGLVVAIAGAIHWWHPYVTADRAVATATPSPGPKGVAAPIPLARGAQACVAPTVLDTRTRKAQIALAATSRPVALVVEASAPGYRSRQDLTVSPSASARLVEASLAAPPRTVTGSVCVRNAGADRIVLLGTNNPVWIGLARTRIDDRELANEAITLNLLEERRRSLIDRLGTIASRASDFAGGRLMPPWLAWLAIVVFVLGTPFAVFAAFWATLRSERS